MSSCNRGPTACKAWNIFERPFTEKAYPCLWESLLMQLPAPENHKPCLPPLPRTTQSSELSFLPQGLPWHPEGKLITPSAELPVHGLEEDSPQLQLLASGAISGAELRAPQGQGPWIIHHFLPAPTQCQVQGRWGVFLCWKKGDKLYLVFFIVTCDFQRSSSFVKKLLQPFNIMPLAFSAFFFFPFLSQPLHTEQSDKHSGILHKLHSFQSPESPRTSMGIKWPWDGQSLTFTLPRSWLEKEHAFPEYRLH